jgi:hypothetical protein
MSQPGAMSARGVYRDDTDRQVGYIYLNPVRPADRGQAISCETWLAGPPALVAMSRLGFDECQALPPESAVQEA